MTTSEINRKFNDYDNKLRRIVTTRCEEMPTTNVGKILIYDSNIFFWNGTEYEEIISESSNYITVEELQDAIDSVGIGTNIFVVDVYSNLPPATAENAGYFYWVEIDEGTWWLPGTLGGNYYKKGLYYSNGTIWETAPVPYQATQAEVNTGTEQYKFVTPSTLQTKLNNQKYTTVLPSTLTHTVLQTTHGLNNVSGINLYTPSGENVLTEYTVIANDVTIYSNINLLNHILKIY